MKIIALPVLVLRDKSDERFLLLLYNGPKFLFPHVSSPRHMNITAIFETSYGVAQELGYSFNNHTDLTYGV
jgi:hypothetical protein